MQMIDYLQQLIKWDVDADQKFMFIRRDDVVQRVSLRGNPESVQDPNIDFDSIQMPQHVLNTYQVNRMYYIKNGVLY